METRDMRLHPDFHTFKNMFWIPPLCRFCVSAWDMSANKTESPVRMEFMLQ